MSEAARIEETAAQWLLRQEDDAWSADDQAALEAWLDAAPAHKVAYWRLEHGWAKVGRLAALRSPAETGRRGSGSRQGWRPWILGGALAASLAVAGFLTPGLNPLGPKTYATEIGGQETVPLADGTRIELNTQTRLRAAVDTRGREVWLERGEAYFEVAHDPSRPFVVHAGAKTVTVLGTKFSVRREGDQVQVAVVEGRVRVEDAVTAPAAGAPPPVLTRGDIVLAQGASTLVTPKADAAVANELSWRSGMLTFDQVTLGDAAGEFNRYNRKKLVVADGTAAQMRIGGRFEADNVEAFARLLQRAYGLKVEDDGSRLTISQ